MHDIPRQESSFRATEVIAYLFPFVETDLLLTKQGQYEVFLVKGRPPKGALSPVLYSILLPSDIE